MPRQRGYRRSRSGNQQSMGGCVLLIGLFIGFWLIVDVVTALGMAVRDAAHWLDQHPFEAVLVVCAVAIAIGTTAYGSFRLWRKSQQAKAAGAQRQYDAYLAHISTLQGLQSLTPTEFEMTVGDLLKSWGYVDVLRSGRAADLAADLKCRDAQGRLTVVQCKRYATGNLVSSPEVQKFIGMIYAHHRAYHGIFVTTSGFTEPALKLALEHNIRMIDGNQLVAFIQQWRATVQQSSLRLASS